MQKAIRLLSSGMSILTTYNTSLYLFLFPSAHTGLLEKGQTFKLIACI